MRITGMPGDESLLTTLGASKFQGMPEDEGPVTTSSALRGVTCDPAQGED
jgi:hypothetical protein